ncbi:hypothetical protein [Muricoccus radiodurans]|uniref:hypothetical protein n=1 Tax=Muricoccus radiodurans TaxID=2231721 RepID=UPI003CF890A7
MGLRASAFGYGLISVRLKLRHPAPNGTDRTGSWRPNPCFRYRTGIVFRVGPTTWPSPEVLMLKALFLAAGLSAAAVAPAAAAFVGLERWQVGDWLIRMQQDMAAPDHPARCILSSIVPAGQVSVLFVHPAHNVASRENPQFGLHLSNTAWQLGPDSSGSAIIEAGVGPLTFDFRRLSEQEMWSPMRSDDLSLVWAASVALEPTRGSGRFPNGQTFAVPPGSDDLVQARGACFVKMNAAQFPQGGAAAPAPVQRDPFAPAR